MAQIKAADGEQCVEIREFYGLNESPDGDTKLRAGEAAVMRNFCISREGSLKKRPGSRTTVKLPVDAPIVGLWNGTVQGREEFLAAAGDRLWRLWDSESGSFICEELGYINCGRAVHFFAFGGMVYVLDGTQYLYYDGTMLDRVEGYRPLVAVAVPPEGGGELLESINRLNGERRMWISPDGRHGKFLLPEENIKSIDYVKRLSDGAMLEKSEYSFELEEASVSFLYEESETLTADGETADFILAADNIAELTEVLLNGVPQRYLHFEREENRLCLYSTEGGEKLTPAAGSTVTVKMQTTLPAGTDSVEIGWSVAESLRDSVESMRCAELYNGGTDMRVFLYSDMSSRAVYSGLDYDGTPRADYFPELNIMDVGDSNTGITGMLRHNARMMVFKRGSAWSVQYGNLELADGMSTSAFYLTPVNRSIGSEALGQVQLILNSPVTISGGNIYEWKNANAYWDNITMDERQVKRISDRVYSAFSEFDGAECVCFDDNPGQSYYVCCGDRALVYNYAADAWYEYTGLRICSMSSFQGELYFGSGDGRLVHMSGEYLSDDGRSIPAYWESGAMSFGSDCMRKYSAMLWVGTKPQDSGEIVVTVQTDRKSSYSEKLVSSALSSFRRWNFERLSFRTNRKPGMKRLKIKAKKFVFYKLIFSTDTADTAATVLCADIRVRATGFTK